ncbi:MAG: 50S ribosomal protein L6 [Bacteroidota bacterium]|nr:50S ribosomal protein L6 [Bacteroidota bacterium]
MSRVGKQPINIPSGVTVSVNADNIVTVKGPKGELTQKVNPDILVNVNDGILSVERPSDLQKYRALHGLYRALIANMIKGVSEGFSVRQELVGVGYKATNQGQLLDLAIGYSHEVIIEIPKEIKLTTQMEKGKNPAILMEAADKQLLGQVAAKIRSLRKPEPYKGKGIRFTGEIVRRKAGKTAGK